MRPGSSVFVLEDDDIDIMTIRRIVQERAIAYPIHWYSDGESGWNALIELSEKRQALPELILLDLNIPRINGLELLRKIKSNVFLKHIPVVVLTTSADPDDRRHCYQSHCAGYLVKTIDPKQFSQKIHAIFDYWEMCATAL